MPIAKGSFYLEQKRGLIYILLVARNALKRKKQHEHSLEQTNGQISMLEQQIYSIESANINQETLLAMKNAGAAMKQIHGKMKMEDVDVTMYVPSIYRALKTVSILQCYNPFRCPVLPCCFIFQNLDTNADDLS